MLDNFNAVAKLIEMNKQFRKILKELVANAAETASKPVAPQGNGMRRMGPHFKAS